MCTDFLIERIGVVWERPGERASGTADDFSKRQRLSEWWGGRIPGMRGWGRGPSEFGLLWLARAKPARSGAL